MIVLGSGITPLGVIRVLARDRLQPIVAETSDPLLRRSRWFRAIPGATPLGTDTGLGTWLAQIPVDSAVLMPCSDSWAREVASLEPALRTRFPASITTPDTLERFVDKGRFSALLRETDTPHPWTTCVDSASDLATLPSDAFESAILKPRDSQRFMRRFGVKACHVRSREHAIEKWQMLIDEGFPVVLQQYIKGPATNHFFVDGFIDRAGVLRAVFVRQRLRMYPLDFGNSTYMVSRRPEDAAPAVASIAALMRHVNYRGMFSAEFKLDERDGRFKLLEVNARAWWYVEFAAYCGVDVCRMAYEDALGLAVPSVERYDVGRTLVYPYFDYFACTELRRSGELSGWRCLRSWLGARQPVFQLRDPVPGLRSFFGTARLFLGRRLRDRAAAMLAMALQLFDLR
ncbi:MAG TPA: hypothetical protein VFI52_12140 [Gemmatimonadaceae bacterium]|nr:hypothetical protein [Gemmatimonadaceae bacterium]